MKKIIFTIIIGIIFVAPLRSFAAAEKFFEYATDVGSPVEVSSGSVATQEFKIYNDYINAVDVWFDNTGSSGSATFSLLDHTNNVLTIKSVTVPHADPFYAGQRLHVTFNKTIGVASGSWYTLKMTSATPQLRLYGIKRVQFVEHNAPYPTDYAVGASSLDGEPQFGVFKFALYEEIDTTPPIITNASSSLMGTDAMKISFNANELVDASLSYGVVGSGSVSDVAFTGNYSICFEGVRPCSITIDTQRDAIYVYRLNVRDSWGNLAYVDGTFASWKSPAQPAASNSQPTTTENIQPQSPQQPLQQPLSIINEKILAVSKSAAVISWETNRAANGTVIISTDPVGGHIIKTITDTTQEVTHTIGTLDALTANTSYYATLISRDQSGMTVAKVISFATLAKSATTTIANFPGPADQLVYGSVSSDQRSMTIMWNAPPASGEPVSGYRIDVIDARGNLVQTKTVVSGIHTVAVAGLPGGEYHALVYANNIGVFEKIAPLAIINVRTIPPPLDTYELIKKPVVYIPAALFVILVGGLYWYSRRQKHSEQ